MDKVVAYFRFLYTLPPVDIDTLAPDSRECAFCLEPYDKTPWGQAEVVNQPVSLACGHSFGVQCVAEWAFSPNFNNICPYCRVPLITDAYRSQDHTSQAIKTALQLRNLFDVQFQSRQEAESFQKLMAETCGVASWMDTLEDQNRMMVIFEEYFKTGDRDPAQLAPLTWREVTWWSLETNLFTQVVAVVVFFLIILTIFIMVAQIVLSLLLESLPRSRIVHRIFRS